MKKFGDKEYYRWAYEKKQNKHSKKDIANYLLLKFDRFLTNT